MTRTPVSGLKSLGHPSVKPTTRKRVKHEAREYALKKYPEGAGQGLATFPARVVIEGYEQAGYKAPYKYLAAAKCVNRYH